LTTRIAVCVSTFRRPLGLAKLLGALALVRVPDGIEMSLIIVDNEPTNAPCVTPVVGDWAVTRVVEQERGIPCSRNRAVGEAHDADAIIFFDDDEQPRPDCVERLVTVWRDTDADVVQGGSVPVFEAPPPEWMIRAGYFRREFERDGDAIPAYMARTSNVLVRRSVFGVADPPFDLRLKLSGGSDSHLFRTAERRGFTFVSAATAIVDEDVPASRIDSGWLVRRQYRTGWGRSFHLRSQDPPPRLVIKRIAAGLVVIMMAPRATWRGRPGLASMYTEGRRSLAYGSGLIVGLFGPKPSEYASIHGE